MALCVLLAAVAADPVTWETPTRRLEAGGRVQLVAIGDDAGSWWTPAGEPIADPPFRLKPHYFTEKARREGRATNFDADPEEGQIERVAVVRVLDIEPGPIDLRFKSERDADVAGKTGAGGVGVSHDVVDAEGNDLSGWKAKARVFYSGVRPTGMEAAVQHGPWIRELSDEPLIITQEEYDETIATGRAIETRPHGTAEYRLVVVDREDGRSRLNFFYRDENHSRAGRFVIHYRDGETKTTAGGSGVLGQTSAMYQTLTPVDRAAGEIESVDIETRTADVATFEDVVMSVHEEP